MIKQISLFFLILLPFLSVGQDDYDGEGCSECELACITCLPFTMMIDSTATVVTGDAQNGFCTIVEHQISWYGFIAGSEDLELTITVDSCEGSSFMEIGIFEALDCQNVTGVSNCYGGSNGNAIGVGGTQVVNTDVPLVIGQYYWIITDATNNIGNHCYYTLEVTDGITGAPPITDVPIIDGPPVLCDNETGIYSISNEVVGASEFEWFVNGNLESTSIDLDFTPSGVGTYEICAAGISYCEAGPLSNPCFEVIVAESTMAEIYFVICEGDCLDYLGTNYCAGGFYQEIILNQQGCDSIIDITLYEIDIDLDIFELGACVPGLGVELVLNPMINANPALDGTEIISWDWYYEGNIIPGTTDVFSIFGDLEGTYSVDYTVQMLGTTCTTIEELDLSFDAYAYIFDTLEDYEDVCDFDIVTYELNYDPYDLTDFSVNWTVPSDAFITMGQGTPLIEVDWTGSGGLVCYTVSNFCTTSLEQCFEVNVSESTPPEITVDPAIVCPGEIVTASVINLSNSYLICGWNTNGAIVIGGNLSTPDDITLEFSNKGLQSIEFYLNDGCEEYTVEATVEVLCNPVFPPYTCLVEGDVLTIDWDDIPNVTNYFANSISGELGTFNGSSYQITNVNPGDNIEIEIIADGPCFPIILTANCAIPDCPTTDLVFQNMIPDTICINAAQQIYDLNGFDNLGNMGTSSFSGTGVTDTINGIFDISEAGAGEHILSYIYSINDGDCISKAFDTIYIIEEPQLNLINTVTNICIGDTTQINLDGLDSLFSLTSFFDGATYVNEDSFGFYSLSWDTAGPKNISFDSDHHYCGLNTQETSISVESFPAIDLMCQWVTSNSIIISWTDDPMYNNYTISVNGIFETNTILPSYTLSNLSVDSTIVFSVLPSGPSSVCPYVEESISCTTSDCPAVETQIQSSLDTILCATDSYSSIQLTLDYDLSLFDGTETILWSGTGVSPDGLFTPDLSLSSIVISATLSHIDCTYLSTIEFLIETPPVLELNYVDEVCIDEPSLLIYDGEINTAYTYTWETNSTASLSNLGATTINFDIPGEYYFTINATLNNCSSESFTTTIMVLDSVRTPQVECFPGTDFINLIWEVDASECNGDYTILLNNVIIEDNYSENSLLIENIDLQSSYQIEIINNSTCLCSSKSAIINCSTILCPENLLGIISSSTIYCLNNVENITLSGQFDNATLSNGMMWSGPGINQDGIIDISQLSEGTVTYMLDYVDADNCTFFTSIELVFIPPPNLEFVISSPACPNGETGTFIYNSAVLPDHTYLIDDQAIDPNQEINVTIGTHTVTVINNGLCESSESFEIVQPETNELLIEGDPIISYGELLSYSILTDPILDIESIIWTFNDSIINTNSDLVFISDAGQLCATIIYNSECQLTACKEINVTNPNVYVPNIININSESQNKSFQLFSNDPNAIGTYLVIYDRWGDLIFNAENHLLSDNEMQWNGIFKEKELNPGVYVYGCKVLFSNGEEELFTGNITLIK